MSTEDLGVTGCCTVYVTASSDDEAATIARVLVTERLVACANLVLGVRSLYWWKGEVQDDREVLILCKTRAVLIDRVIARVKEIHSYACPCVVALPIVAGNPGYLDWIAAETGEK
jgi:periplasmic divalent cation tolerance protein